MKNIYRTILASIFAFTVVMPISAQANEKKADQPALKAVNFSKKSSSKIDLNGWDYLYIQLVAKGLDAEDLAEIFSDPRMPANEPVMFSVVPKEPRNIYSKLNTAKNRRNALSFYRKYQDFFIAAEKTYNVPQSVILSIAQIESRCGVYTGKHPVFYRLARIAQAAAPDNLDENFRLKRLIDKKLTFKQVSDRGKWLEKTFLPHLAATLPIAQKMGIHPLELKGSLAGAIGIPQFLPGNVIEYGVDANQNGVVSLHEPEDAILSLAKFLHMHGWKTEKSIPKNRNIIQHYNNSDPYIDNVVAMAQALKAHTATLD